MSVRKARGCAKAAKAKAKASAEAPDVEVMKKTLKNYCQGRGCRHRVPLELKPTAICFYMRYSNCSHAEIKSRMEDLLARSPGAKLVAIQYVPLPVHLDKPGGDVRWVVTLNTVDARNKIAGRSMFIKGQKVTMRRHDDVTQLEYRKCSRSTHAQNVVDKIQNLEIENTDMHGQP